MVTVSPPDTWVYALRLPPDPRAARVARMTVRAALDGHGLREVRDVVELLTSELVTNAYRHTKGPASLRLTALGGGRLRVGVGQQPAHPRAVRPVARQSSRSRPGGRRRGARVAPRTGMRGLVGRLGARRRPLGAGAGKLLWFEVGGDGAAARQSIAV